MAFKFVLVSVTILVAAIGAVPVQSDHHGEPAHYEFSYSVNDEHTGDIKSQQESRNGDVVHGRYELIDSDGFKRIVEYTADEHTGFHATVHREPTHIRIPVPASNAQHYSHPQHQQNHYQQQYQNYQPQQHHHHHAATVQHAAPIVQKVQKTTVTAAPVQHQQQFQHNYQQEQLPEYVRPIHVAAVHSNTKPSVPASHAFTGDANHVTFNAPGVNYNF